MDTMTLFTTSATRSRRATASIVAGMTLAGAAAVCYLLAVRRLRRRQIRWPAARTVAFLLGCGLLIAATDTRRPNASSIVPLIVAISVSASRPTASIPPCPLVRCWSRLRW